MRKDVEQMQTEKDEVRSAQDEADEVLSGGEKDGETVPETEPEQTPPEQEADVKEEGKPEPEFPGKGGKPDTKKKKDLKAALEKKDGELAEQKDQYLRLMAEYQNYRNRTTEEKKKIYGDAKMDCVKELLAVIDSFERAMEAPCTDESYKRGVALTFTQMQKAFEKLGVTEVPALGEAFDPNVHNAIKQVDDSEYDSDIVCEVFQKGYLLGDRLIRPAMVAVAV